MEPPSREESPGRALDVVGYADLMDEDFVILAEESKNPKAKLQHADLTFPGCKSPGKTFPSTSTCAYEEMFSPFVDSGTFQVVVIFDI
ncbi:hypothetical protein E2562_015184 [Oryza meyeriana var. granulata]|uniref:Uncharacterized protein n=1 Tax=Oryza meyeriana var. granulata TaxID=110450 RepID=A0A6G1EWW0_9ORYZ|nr:hypothetical protein E2562_015184 [Oryza meyeriana var. granulata]